jgi:invasion protein IalB
MIRRPTQGMKMKALSRGALLAFSLASVPQFGFAASPAPLTPPREDLPPSEPEVAPRGRHSPRDINYSQWRKLCFKAPGKEALCRTTITGTWATGQMAIRLDLIEREGASRLQILLPVGVYLQAGVKLRLDTTLDEIRLPYSWCFSNVCVAAAPIDRKGIRALGEARAISVEVLDTNLLTLTATIPVDQFASAHSGAPAEVFEQIIEE